MTLKIPNNKNLIIAAVGDKSLHRYWMNYKNTNFDVCLIYYGNKEIDHKAKFFTKQAGSKYHLIYNEFLKRPELWNYEYIWMPDDDIAITANEIEQLFELAKKYDLWICQPSLLGWYGLSSTLHQPNCHLRYTNYVEIMCPCFNKEALKRCICTFIENKSGWGIDAVWNILLNRPTDKLAIIDDIVAIHTRPIGSGDLYKNVTNCNSTENAMKEAIAIYEKYNLRKENYEDMKKGQIVSAELFYTLYYNIVEYSRIYRSTEAGVPTSNRLSHPCKILEYVCQNVNSMAL